MPPSIFLLFRPWSPMMLLSLTNKSPISHSSDMWIGIHLPHRSFPPAFSPRLLQCCRLRPELRRSYLHHCGIWHNSLHKRLVEWLHRKIHKSALLVLKQPPPPPLSPQHMDHIAKKNQKNGKRPNAQESFSPFRSF